MAPSKDLRTLVCGGCGKRYRVAGSVDRSALKCRDCGGPLKRARKEASASGPDRDPRRPVRRKKSPWPVLIALGASAVLVIVAVWIYSEMDWLTQDQESDAAALDAEDAARLKKLRSIGAVAVDPFREKLEAMVDVLHRYQVSDFPLYLESAAIFEFTMRERNTPRRWTDLPLGERLQYPDNLRKEEPFSSRWRLANLGEMREERSEVPGYLDHRWVVVPREFPGGEKDEVWLLVRDDAGRPRIRGCRRTVIQDGLVAKKEEGTPEAPTHEDTPGFQKVDPALKREALPATTEDGPIDVRGQPLAPIEAVPLLEGTSAVTEASLKAHIAELTDPEATRRAQQALKELVLAGKPAIPVLLNSLVGKDLRNAENVHYCHQVVQALREITGQRFGFEPQTGENILTAASASEQVAALKRWFGWWKLNASTFEPVLSPQLQQELEKRQRAKERAGK